MKNKKPVSPNAQNQGSNTANEAMKNISDLSKTELARKKKVDPEIE